MQSTGFGSPRRDAVGTVLILATVTTGLTAGLLYAYACSVLPGLARADDRTFITVFQNINEAIQNPVFFAGFLGAPVLTAVAALQAHRRGRADTRRRVVAALACYLLALLVTVAINVPLNNQLAAAGDAARLADPAAVRDRFELPWIIANIARTLFATAALAFLGRALVRHGRSQLSSVHGVSDGVRTDLPGPSPVVQHCT